MKVILKLAATCVLAGGLAFGALLGFTTALNGSVQPQHVSAGADEINPNAQETYVYITASQTNGIMYVAYFDGPAVSAYYFCGVNYPSSPGFSDCFSMLTNTSYSYPILQFWAHYGKAILFQWNRPWNQYLGYAAF